MTINLGKNCKLSDPPQWYGQLSPCGHLATLDTALLWTAAKFPENKKLLKTTPTIMDCLCYGQ